MTFSDIKRRLAALIHLLADTIEQPTSHQRQGSNSYSQRGGPYSVLKLRLDIRPIQLQQPLYRYR